MVAQSSAQEPVVGSKREWSFAIGGQEGPLPVWIHGGEVPLLHGQSAWQIGRTTKTAARAAAAPDRNVAVAASKKGEKQRLIERGGAGACVEEIIRKGQESSGGLVMVKQLWTETSSWPPAGRERSGGW